MQFLLCSLLAAAAFAQTLPGDRVIASDVAVGSLSYSADGVDIAGLCLDGKVRFWDARTGSLKRAVPFDKEDRVTLHGRAGAAAAAAGDGSVRIYDLKTGEVVRRLTGATSTVRTIVFSPDRKMFAGASRLRADGSENAVRTWDASGAAKLSLPAGLGGISAMAFSPDGGAIVAAGYDTDIRAWSTRNGELLRLMDDLPLSTFAMAFSPDGKYLATGGADRVVYLWDTKTWRIARKLTGQPELIYSLAFSPDGRLLVSGGASELTFRNPAKALFWDVATGKPVRSVTTPHLVTSAAFSPDGTQLATSSEQTISIWAVPAASPRP